MKLTNKIVGIEQLPVFVAREHSNLIAQFSRLLPFERETLPLQMEKIFIFYTRKIILQFYNTRFIFSTYFLQFE